VKRVDTRFSYTRASCLTLTLHYRLRFSFSSSWAFLFKIRLNKFWTKKNTC